MVGIEGIPKSEIYEIKIKFIKDRKCLSKKVSIEIRLSKKSRIKKRKLPFPENIDEMDLNWIKYSRQKIAIYTRKGGNDNYIYLGSENIIVSKSLGQKLEELVYAAFKIR